MGHVFYDIFSIINVSFLQLKFYLRHGLQNGSFTCGISVLLLGDARYKSLGLTKIYFMHFCLFSTFSISTLFSFRLCLVF